VAFSSVVRSKINPNGRAAINNDYSNPTNLPIIFKLEVWIRNNFVSNPYFNFDQKWQIHQSFIGFLVISLDKLSRINLNWWLANDGSSFSNSFVVILNILLKILSNFSNNFLFPVVPINKSWNLPPKAFEGCSMDAEAQSLGEIFTNSPHLLDRNFCPFPKKGLAERSQNFLGYSRDSGLSNRAEEKI
jgi:hypothetical protein